MIQSFRKVLAQYMSQFLRNRNAIVKIKAWSTLPKMRLLREIVHSTASTLHAMSFHVCNSVGGIVCGPSRCPGGKPLGVFTRKKALQCTEKINRESSRSDKLPPGSKIELV